jgi:hypothetical protein
LLHGFQTGLAQVFRVVRQVLGDEGRDEVVTVIIAGVPAQRQRLLRASASRLEEMRVELRCDEFVGETLIDEGLRDHPDGRADAQTRRP